MTRQGTTYADGCYFVNTNKFRYMDAGYSNRASTFNEGNSTSAWIMNSITNMPLVPINGQGSIDTVKSFFGYSYNLNDFLSFLAGKEGYINAETLVNQYQFTINGVTQYGDEWAGDLVDEDGVPLPLIPGDDGRSAVSWFVVYEPIVVIRVQSPSNWASRKIAYTATDLMGAIAAGYDCHWQNSTAHKVLPGSVYLEYPWFNLETGAGKFDSNASSETVFNAGGYGARHLGRTKSSLPDVETTIVGAVDIETGQMVDSLVGYL